MHTRPATTPTPSLATAPRVAARDLSTRAASITLRPESLLDAPALSDLAALDSAAAPPPAPLLLAEADGELVAALSLADGTAIADPFRPTSEIVELLRRHAAALHASPRRSSRRGGALGGLVTLRPRFSRP